MAQADVDDILAKQPDKLPEVDWDDPKAVAQARGDATPTGGDSGEGTRSSAEQAAREQAKGQAKDQDQAKGQAKDSQAKDSQAKDSQAKDSQDHRIPKSRFDEVNTRAKNAESEVATLKTQLAKYEARDELLQAAREKREQENADREAQDAYQARLDKVDTLEGTFTKLVSENKLDEATQVRQQIARLNREIARDEANAASVEVGEQTREQIAYDGVVAKLESKHPEFDPENVEKYDQELVDTALALAQGYQTTQAMTPEKALLKAVKAIMPSTQGKKGLSDTKKQEAIQRGLDAAAKQGVDHDGVGSDGDEAGMTSEVDATQLTESDLAAMPESKLKQLRGDFV